MYRELKGHSIQSHVDDYCIIDLETTSHYVNSTRIVEVSSIKVRGNQVVGEFSTLVNPRCPIPPEATARNSITDEMVKDAPYIEDVIDSFIEFIGNDTIIGYNNARFDMNIIYNVLMRLYSKPFTNNYIDMLFPCKRCLPSLENHTLETVSKFYLLDTTGEHRALKDCYLTKSVYDKLYSEYGERAFRRESPNKHFAVHYTEKTLALQQLLGLLENTIKDGKISLSELSELQTWAENHADLEETHPFDRLFYTIDKVLEDGKADQDELDELLELFSDIVDPVKSRVSHSDIKTLYGKHIVVTGDFNYGSRPEVCALIESAGGIVDKTVKRATNYVVVGSKGSSNWKTDKYGGKIQKAMELNDNGSAIEIIEESDFIPAIKRIINLGIIN